MWLGGNAANVANDVRREQFTVLRFLVQLRHLAVTAGDADNVSEDDVEQVLLEMQLLCNLTLALEMQHSTTLIGRIGSACRQLER